MQCSIIAQQFTPCSALAAIMAAIKKDSQQTTSNPQLAPRNATRDPQLATRDPQRDHLNPLEK